MRTGKLSRCDAWTAITTTIWRTLSYLLPALNLTRQQCDKILAPILHYGLPATGICWNFPHRVVFTPANYIGCGWTHLHTSQEIMWLEDLIKHTYLRTTMGELYRTSLKLLFTSSSLISWLGAAGLLFTDKKHLEILMGQWGGITAWY